MSGEVVGWAMKQATGSPTTKLVLVKLADNANEEGFCWPSMQKLVDHTELSERAVRKHLYLLEKMGLIFIERRNIDGVQLKNRFQLNLQYAGVLHVVPPVHEVPAVSDEHEGVARRATTPRHEVHAKLDNPQTEPSLNPHSHASVGPVEIEWPKVWAAFQTWPGLPPTASEPRARRTWEQLRHQLPADLVSRVLAHGVSIARHNRIRGKAGPLLVPNPHNWLERDRGWEAYPTEDIQEIECDRSWGDIAEKLKSTIGHKNFDTYFAAGKFESGPPPRISFPRRILWQLASEKFPRQLEKCFGEEVILEVAA